MGGREAARAARSLRDLGVQVGALFHRTSIQAHLVEVVIDCDGHLGGLSSPPSQLNESAA